MDMHNVTINFPKNIVLENGNLNISEDGYVYPESVINEITKGSLEKILEVANITTRSPGKEYIAKAREAALSTGIGIVLGIGAIIGAQLGSLIAGILPVLPLEIIFTARYPAS